MKSGIQRNTPVWMFGSNSGVVESNASNAMNLGARFWTSEADALEAYADKLAEERVRKSDDVVRLLTEETQYRTRVDELRRTA